MGNKIKKSLLALAVLIGLSSSVFATTDTIRVIRGGKLIKTMSPIVRNLTVEGSLVSEAAFTTSGDISITKDKPLLTLTSATDSDATIVLNSGDTKDSFLTIKQDGTERWTFGNDYSDSNSFILSSGGTIGSNNVLKATTAGVTVPGILTSTGALIGSSTLTVTGTSLLKGDITAGNAIVTGNLLVQKSVRHNIVTLGDGVTEINAALGDIFVTQANTGATEITSITNASPGQVITLIGGSSTNATTISDSGDFKLSGGFTAETSDSLTLTIVDASTFVECARADN